MFRFSKPIVAAVHGAAIGGGLGLAMTADFRVSCPEARLSANFTRLGFHPGFGLSITLPRAIGRQAAAMVLYTSRRLGGEEAARIGLVDLLVPQDRVRAAALELATEIAGNAPLAVVSTRATQRAGLADEVEKMLAHELAEQTRLTQTRDFKEGVAAMAERRAPKFTGA
jgi:enoyl-CoA hydratase/carnithine racemase